MKFSFSSFLTKLTLTASVASVLVGCDEPDYGTPTPVTESTVGRAQVLVVNAAPGTQGVTTTFENLPFGTVTPYLASPVGTYTTANAGLRLFVFNDPTNIPATPSGVPTGTAPITAPRPLTLRTALLGNTNYTIFLVDPPTRAYAYPVTATSDPGGIRSVILTDNLTAPSAGNAKIRFVNMATSGTYGIFNGATSLFSAVPFRAVRAVNSGTAAPVTNYANFTEVAAGTYNLDVRSVATTPLVGTARPVTLAAGKIYTLYTRGIPGTSGVTALGISTVEHN
jgi:hypothetical protein